MSSEDNVGVQKCSFNDSPTGTATVIFFQGCNLRCGYCYNVNLVHKTLESKFVFSFKDTSDDGRITLAQVIRDNISASGGKPHLKDDWYVFSGGEATMRPYEIKTFMEEEKRIRREWAEAYSKESGMSVDSVMYLITPYYGLFTNGYDSGLVELTLKTNKFDWISVDYKNPLFTDVFKRSMNIITQHLKNIQIQTVATKDTECELGYMQEVVNDISFSHPDIKFVWKVNELNNAGGEAKFLDKDFDFFKNHQERDAVADELIKWDTVTNLKRYIYGSLA